MIRDFLTAAPHRLVRGLVMGDSTGVGVIGNDSTQCWPYLFRDALQARFGDGGSGWASHVNYIVGFLFPGDANGVRMEETGSWTGVSGGAAHNHRRPTTPGAGATMTFFGLRGSELDLYTRTGVGFGSFQVQVNTGSGFDAATTHSQNAAAATVKTNVRSGLPKTATYSVKITNNSGDGRFIGFDAHNTTGIAITNVSSGGASYAAPGPDDNSLLKAAEGLAGETTLSQTMGMFPQLDFLIVLFGLNDANLNSLDADIREAQTEISGRLRAKFHPSTPTLPPQLVVLNPHQGKFDTDVVSNDAARVSSVILEWAAGTGAELVDLWKAGRYSWEWMNQFNYWAFTGVFPTPDPGHYDPPGNRWIFGQVLERFV